MRPLILTPPQEVAVPFMLDNPRCALWAGCGLGKTSAALWVADTLKILGDSRGPTLVCGPMRVARDGWADEAAKWEQFEHMKIRWIGGTAMQRAQILKWTPLADVYTISYELLPWLIEHLQADFPFRNVVADESDNLKGFRISKGGKRAHAIARVAHTLVDRWVNLTGTPAPNGLKDLWGQTWFLDRGQRLGLTHGAFMDRWFRTNQYTRRTEPMPFSDTQIHEALKDLCLTIDPKDYFDLHEPIVKQIDVKLPAAARAIYQNLEKDLFAELVTGTEVEVFNEAALTNKCLQLSNGAIYTEHPKWEAVHDEKIEAMRSVISECGGAPVLVAYEFQSDRDRIVKAFGKDVALLATKDGLAAFKAGDKSIGLAHPKSMGHGIDGLQYVTNILIRFGHNWHLGQRIQMLERIGPMRQFGAGFNRPVFVYDLITLDTLDEDVLARHEGKITVQDALLAAMKRRG